MSNAKSLALVLAGSLFSGCGSAEDPAPSAARILCSPLEHPREIVEETPPSAPGEVPDAEPVEVVLEEEEPVPEEPILANEALASSAFNDVIGIGGAGGSGGKFAARCGGKKTLRSAAGSALETTRESYAPVHEPGFRLAQLEPLSTFSLDVDTASYTNVRRHLLGGTLPPVDAVRIEELLNDFRYDDAPPAADEPFAVTTEVASCPWEPSHRLVRIGMHARALPLGELPPANLVFLVDVAGSMQSPDKLPLVVASLRMLVMNLSARDRVALVVLDGIAHDVTEKCPSSPPMYDPRG